MPTWPQRRRRQLLRDLLIHVPPLHRILVRAILVNSGNANCATGAEGLADARGLAASLAREVGCPDEQVLFLSTGVIGARLPVAQIESALPRLLEAAHPGGLADFGEAIRTTDTHRKLHEWQSMDSPHRLVGAAKGSGMIHPDMATMLGFLLTDAPAPASPHALLQRACDRSFNLLSVDGDTSPNDTVLAWFGAGAPAGAPSEELERGMTRTCAELCRMIAADGGGATRVVVIHITGARCEEDAARVARVVSTSPLVKTAIHGRDPNWGRIVSAAGRAGVPFDPERSRLRIGGALVYEGGRPLPENEPEASRSMQMESEGTFAIPALFTDGHLPAVD